MAVRGQILAITAIMIAIVLMGIIVSVYEAHVFFLKTRSVVVREVIGSITADFERAMATVLAVATRGYFNYTRFYDLCSRFSGLGLTFLERHNFTVARIMAYNYLQYWRTAVVEAYSGYGVQVDFEIEELDLAPYLGRSRRLENLVAGYWYYSSSCSVAHARLKLNLTALGFYGWESPVTVGLFLRILESKSGEGYTILKIEVRADAGEPYPLLVTRGWIEVYYPEEQDGEWTGRWTKANITDVTYKGNGVYLIKLKPEVAQLTDPLTGNTYVPLLVVVSDHRGILVEALTYNHIVFKVRKRVPDILTYYTEFGEQKTLQRPFNTPYEVYTLEFGSNLKFYWLDMELPVDPNLRVPPLPFMPIKQLLINVSRDGTTSTLIERPVQYENWTLKHWHDRDVWVPYGLPDPTIDIRPLVVTPGGQVFAIRFVFQVPFPRRDIKEQYVVIWWNDSLDAVPKVWGTSIRYEYDPSHHLKDLVHPELRIELVDTEHTEIRSYDDYGGVAALALREPEDVWGPSGPWNIHGFGYLEVRIGRDRIYKLNRFRPYGKWTVYSHYLGKYSWMQAPIRIFAVLDTDYVASVYEEDSYFGNPITGYYSTLAILEVINGTRYIPLIMHVYWQKNRYNYSYWLYSLMGAGVPTDFAYMTGWDDWGFAPGWWWREFSEETVRKRSYSYPCPAERGECWRCYHTGFNSPGLWVAHWCSTIGKGVIGNENLVALLRKSKDLGYEPMFYVTRCGGPTGIQNSLEVKLADGFITVEREEFNPLLNYWLVLMLFDPPSVSEGWKGLYYYAPMFWKAYAPEIVSP